jgi:hypothetical protein
MNLAILKTLERQPVSTKDRWLAELLADPHSTADLREALVGTPQADLAEKQARNLKDKNPVLRKLISELRKHGFIPK